MTALCRLASLAFTFAALAPAPASGQNTGVIHTLTVPAPSLRRNLVGDSDARAVSIYLPPSYSRFPRRRYPTLYLLHGFGGDNYTTWIGGKLQNLNVRVSLDSLIGARNVGEMIVVMPNARNRFDGSFYANSPVTGNWEDFVVRDLLGYVDTHYRTIDARSARGIAGWSMGGYGALRLGMKHPELFSAIYALSPCCLVPWQSVSGTTWVTTIALRDTAQFKPAGFSSNMAIALAAVYSPDSANPPFYVDFPFASVGGALVPDSMVMKKWKSVLSEAADDAVNLRGMKIGFDAGRADGFTDIPINAAALDKELTQHGIPHYFEMFEGTHGSRLRTRLEEVVFPFFSSSFARNGKNTASQLPAAKLR